MHKKGEMTTQQIVILIVLLISFVVILFFLFRLNLGKTSEAEVCHNSVVTRGNPVLSKGSVPLNCQRQYICLSADGSCEKTSNSEIKKVENVDDIYNILAEEMANCWWMFGEGKINYIGDKVTKQNYCSVCSQIAFDDSIKDLVGDEPISQDDFYGAYLAKTPISDENENYAEYMFGTNNIGLIKQSVYNNVNNTKGISTFGTINPDETYFVMTGITSEIGNTYKWIGAGLGVFALLTPVGLVGGAIIIGTGAGVGAVGGDVAEFFEPKIAAVTVKGDGVDNEFMAPTVIEARAETFDLLNCKDTNTLA